MISVRGLGVAIGAAFAAGAALAAAGEALAQPWQPLAQPILRQYPEFQPYQQPYQPYQAPAPMAGAAQPWQPGYGAPAMQAAPMQAVPAQGRPPLYAQQGQPAAQPRSTRAAAGAPSAARETKSGWLDRDDVSLFAFSAGYFDINRRRDTAAEGRIEYRAAERFWLFKPFGGLMATSDEAIHAFAGVLIDIYLGDRFVVTPSFAPGYFHKGDGRDLGHKLEFRSQIEVAYRFADKSRLGVSFNHISNAGIGDRNPGTETLAITYALPTDTFFNLF